MDSEELKDRTKIFAHRCVKMAFALPNTVLGRHIKGQLIRCSTSVASNYRATCLSQSKASFVAKISIVIEECDESCFWMEFIIDENLLKNFYYANFLEVPKLEIISLNIGVGQATQNQKLFEFQ